MENDPFENIKTVRHLSNYMDHLIIKAVSAGMHDPEIEKDLRELNDMLKALDHTAQSIANELEEE